MNRDADARARLGDRREPWDIVVIGGGATGLGVAVDAAARGYRTSLLLERDDFGKGTSSRSTKLVHGGVRYLEQGQRRAGPGGAARARPVLRRNAPHLVHDLRVRRAELRLVGGAVLRPRAASLRPARRAAAASAASRSSVARRDASRCSRRSSRRPARRRRLPRRPVRRRPAAHQPRPRPPSTAARRCRTTCRRPASSARTQRRPQRKPRLAAWRRSTGRRTHVRVRARVMVNATGIFADGAARARGAGPRAAPDAQPRLARRGERRCARTGERARQARPSSLRRRPARRCWCPKTADGRVVFALPWHERVVIGTTDVATAQVELDPVPTRAESPTSWRR